MIRPFRYNDYENIDEIIRTVDTDFEQDDVELIAAQANVFLVYDDGQINGFAYATISTDDNQEEEIEVKLYVEPKSRKQGIGSKLYHKLIESLDLTNSKAIISYIRVDLNDPTGFCEKLGFSKWWGSPELIFKGAKFPDLDITFHHYKDKFYEQYRGIKNECYYEIQRSNDIKPYTYPFSDEEREQLLKNRENVYLVLDNDQIVASVTIGDGEIDNLMVAPTHQGKGYGKKSLQFAMNNMLDQGYDEIRICYMEGNASAEKLYFSLGFEALQHTHVYRKIL